MLSIENLTKEFSRPNSAEQIIIFDRLNLQVDKSETVSIMGRSGSGKSTLLAMIAGLDQNYQGDISFSGINLKNASEARLAQFRAENIGIVFQQYHLMEHLSALENVMLPLEILSISDAADKAKNLLQRVGLEDRTNHFPHQLSGGEKQRVAIARSIVSNRSLILADEPTGNLDEKNGKIIIQLFFELVEIYHSALILVTHSLEIAKRAKRILTIKDRMLQSV